MPYTINQLKQRIFKPVYDVYQIIQDFFGEPCTDLQGIPTDEEFQAVLESFDMTPVDDLYNLIGPRIRRINSYYDTLRPSIYVWWPRVTVTNENDRSVEIQDLYARIDVTREGRIPYENRGFKLTRSTFSEVQFKSGYCHSHVPSFRYSDGPPPFDNPCLGTGPINNTIMDLKNQYEEALWMLFCQELAMYVTVESLRGGPHFRMEYIVDTTMLSNNDYSSPSDMVRFYNEFDTNSRDQFYSILRAFTLWYLDKGHLNLSFKDGRYIQGMPYYDYMIDISNSFIEWFNQNGDRRSVNGLYRKNVIDKVLVSNAKFYKVPVHRESFDAAQYEGRHVLYFKGRDITLHIEADHEFQEEPTILLNHNIAMFILYNTLKVINYRYRNEHNRQQTGSGRTERTSTPAYQAVCYI